MRCGAIDVVRPFLGHLVVREDCVHRALADTGVAVDALLRIDEELLRIVEARLIRRRVDAVHWTDLDAGGVLALSARLGDDVGHGAVTRINQRGCWLKE